MLPPNLPSVYKWLNNLELSNHESSNMTAFSFQVPRYNNTMFRLPPSPGRSSVERAVRQRLNNGRSFTRTGTRSENYGGGFSSGNRETVTRYKRKRMPAKRRRRWKRFVRKVDFVNLKGQPLQFYTVSGTASVTASANASTSWGRMLLGMNVSGNDEVWKLFQQAYNDSTVAYATGQKIYLKSACLDLQITNNKGAGDATEDETATAIIDVYHLISRNSYGLASTVHQHFTDGLGDIASPSGGGTVSSTSVTLTPFMNPSFCKFWKVLKKTEVQLPTAQTTTMQIRLPKDMWIEGKRVQQNPQALAGRTRAILLIVRGIPRYNGTTSEFGSINLTVGYQTSLTYAIPPGKTAESGSTN